MKELAGRLTAVDPDAGAAVRVIAYFDALAESRAGLEALVRAAAVLAGCPARLVDDERRVRVRVEPDGRRLDSPLPPEPGWPSAALVPGGVPALWLERPGDGGPSVVDAVILERAAGALRLVLDRTRGRAPLSPADDPALVETLLDATATEQARLHAARRLGLAVDARARVVAPLGGRPRVLVVGDAGAPDDGPHRGAPVVAVDGSHGIERRVGVGPVVSVPDLPRSWAAARVALRFTAEGTARDPGERVVRAEDLGGLALLAESVVPGGDPPPDVRELEKAAADAPWMLATLHAVASTASLRAAATEVNVHHSTLQDRLTHAESLLGWPVRDPHGRLRLQLALTMRRLARG